MNDSPKCLIGVPTFRRPHFLPRILACFKRLNYDNKKLIIINDDPECSYYIYDDPEIDIINIDNRIQVSVKRNLFLSWDFDIMFPLDDDDLFLPNRLVNHIKEYQTNPTIDLYRNRNNLFITNNEIRQGGSAFTNSSFTRKGIFKAGGYSSFNQSNSDDISLKNNFHANCSFKIEHNPNINDIDFIYQWGGSNYHNSFNKHIIMSEEMEIKSKLLSKTGKIHLNIDYEEYDNIVNISQEVINNNQPVNIRLENNGANIRKV